MTRTQWKAKLALVAAGTVLLAACSSSGSDTDAGADESGGGDSIVIAATNFSESALLGSMYQQVLEANGVDASVKELTTREVIIPAMKKGEVQLTPEYLGSLTNYMNKEANGADAPEAATADAKKTYAEAQKLAKQEDLTVLEPSPAQNQNAFAVTKDLADSESLASLSDLGTYSQDSPITLGGPPECPKRAFCQPGLEETYDVQVGSFVPLDAGGPLTFQGLQQDKINVGVVFSSSGSIAADDLVVLEDDKGLEPAENITPAMYSPAVTDTITDALDSVSAALTTDDLQRMNAEVEIDRKKPEEVAKQFLTDKGLLSE